MRGASSTNPRRTRPAKARVDFGRSVLVVRRARFSRLWQTRTLVVCGALALGIIAVTLWALASGPYPLSVSQVMMALTDHPDAGFARTVVVDWRLPRAHAAIVFGMALGVSGAVFQSLSRNALASPDIIGFSSGAYTGALIVMLVMGGGYLQVAVGTLVGGIATAALVYFLSWRQGIQGFRLIVVGIGIASMLGSLNTWMLLKAQEEVLAAAAAWGAGTLLGITWPTVIVASITIAILLMVLSALAADLRQLELGDDAAVATGIRVERVRLLAMLVGIALLATVVAAAGPISFVALAAPQIARRLARTPGVTLTSAALVGGLMLALSDHIAQNLLPKSLPVGVVTVVIGGAYLMWLIVREVRRRTRV